MRAPLQSPTAALSSAPPDSAPEDVGPEELISVARIVRPQGRHGEVVAELLTDFPDRFARLRDVHLRRPDSQLSVYRLERSWLHKGRIVLKFEGCDSIDRAEELRDSAVMIARQQLIALPEDTYYDFDLIGCEVLTVDGKRLGWVTEVQQYGAAPLLAVEDEDRRELLIPLVLSICIEVDVARKRIIVSPVEGLLDL
jgi:16S rRNA processing protein RimM